MIPDILVVGGGIIGLGIALELRDRGAQVQVLEGQMPGAATPAAAGMLAPQAEDLAPGPLLDLCLLSRGLYGPWTEKLTARTSMPSGYWPCGILAPLYQNPSRGRSGVWLDLESLREKVPGLSVEVTGGWWFSMDAQVDNQALWSCLLKAVQLAGVEVLPAAAVKFHHRGDKVEFLETGSGCLSAGHYVLAAGAWSSKLYPLPVAPLKGQMLVLRGPRLDQVVFGPDVYLVPRRDGRLLVGATTEEVGFTPGNTAAGISNLLQAALRLLPTLASYTLEGYWWGFRPSTPDGWPILGPSQWDNLTLATGHLRNGILLAPATAQLISNWVWERQTHPLLEPFGVGRPSLQENLI